MADTSVKFEIVATLRDQMTRTFATLRQSVSRFLAPLSGAFRALGKALTDVRSLLGGVVAYLGARALVQHTRDVARAAAETERWSTRLGMTVGEMDALEYVAEQTGTSIGAMRDGLANLQEKLGKAADGSSELRAAFGRLGLEVLDPVTGQIRDAVHLLPELAQAFQDMRAAGRGGELVGLSEDLLGGQGSELAALLLRGPQEISRALGRVQELGVMTARQAATARVVTQAFADSDRTVRGLQLALLEAFGPEIVATLRTFGDLVRENRDALVAFVRDVGALAVQGLRVAAQVTITIVRGVLDAIDFVAEKVAAVGRTISGFLSGGFYGMFGQSRSATAEARAGLAEFEGSLGRVGQSFEAFSAKWAENWDANRAAATREINRVVVTGTGAADEIKQAWSPFFTGWQEGFRAWRNGLRDFRTLGQQSATQTLGAVEDGLAGFVANVVKGTESIKDAWKSMLRAILDDWIATFARITARSALEAIIGAFTGGLSKGAITPGGGGSVTSPGGTITPGGSGADLRSFGGGGGGGLTVNINVQAVDADSVNRLFRTHGQSLAGVVVEQLGRNQALKGAVRRR
ncbi:MAG: hypothetical protein IT379_16875 [Deltaproteobacteria bacterium]|nr:hypothetical protein [Deltaproteobacteria bacterium]